MGRLHCLLPAFLCARERDVWVGSGLFASLGSGLVQTLGQIVFIREKKLSNTNLLESRHIKEKKASLPVDVRRSKTSLLKLPTMYCARVSWRKNVIAVVILRLVLWRQQVIKCKKFYHFAIGRGLNLLQYK